MKANSLQGHAREDAVLAVVRQVLDDDSIDLDDNFFSAGGDSMRSLEVVQGLAVRGLIVKILDVLTADSLRDLAGSARDAAGGASQTVRDVEHDGLPLPPGVGAAWPATQLQVGMLFLSEMSGSGAGVYVDFCGVRVGGGFKQAALDRALTAVLERHEVLRSFFDLASYDVPAQVVVAEVTLVPECVTANSTDEAEHLVERWRDDVIAAGVDVMQAPPLRCHVVVEPDHFRLSLATHHSIVDGWSFYRLVVDLLTEYDAAVAGREAGLPTVPRCGGEFVRLEQEALRAPGTQRFWRQHNAGLPVLGETGDVARASRQLIAPLSTESWVGLRRTAEALQVPLKSLCLAAHARALGFWRDQTEIVTGLVSHGRPEMDGADRVVGLFLNTIPLRLPADRPWSELATAALRAEREMYPHRRYPLATMVAERGGPLFDVTFNFTHFHLVRELKQLAVPVASWWDQDIATFPVLVDVFMEDPMLAHGAMVTFDPQLVEEAAAQRLLSELTSTLEEVAHIKVRGAGNA